VRCAFCLSPARSGGGAQLPPATRTPSRARLSSTSAALPSLCTSSFNASGQLHLRAPSPAARLLLRCTGAALPPTCYFACTSLLPPLSTSAPALCSAFLQTRLHLCCLCQTLRKRADHSATTRATALLRRVRACYRAKRSLANICALEQIPRAAAWLARHAPHGRHGAGASGEWSRPTCRQILDSICVANSAHAMLLSTLRTCVFFFFFFVCARHAEQRMAAGARHVGGGTSIAVLT